MCPQLNLSSRLTTDSGLVLRVDSFVGCGGQGKVYRATLENHRDPVALKLFHESHATTKAKKRIRYLAQLHLDRIDSGICAPFETITKGKLAGHVAPFVVGPNLLESLENASLTYLEVEDVALQIAKLTQGIMRKGIIHGDIQTQNFKITLQNNRIQVFMMNLDNYLAFGVPRPDMIGMTLYLAPENWQEWWESFITNTRSNFQEIRNFFNSYIMKFSHNTLEPFLPDTIEDRTTITGATEEIISDAFLLYFDIIRSKKTPATVKDAFAVALRSSPSEVVSSIKFTEASDDAFVIVTKTWENCLDVARGCHNVVQLFPKNPDGFGGIRMTLVKGPITLIRRPNGDSTPRDATSVPVIPRAAYMADGVKKILQNDGDYINRIIMSAEVRDYLVHQKILRANTFIKKRSVKGKDGFVAIPHIYDINQ